MEANYIHTFIFYHNNVIKSEYKFSVSTELKYSTNSSKRYASTVQLSRTISTLHPLPLP